jgi:hypothetical protein
MISLENWRHFTVRHRIAARHTAKQAMKVSHRSMTFVADFATLHPERNSRGGFLSAQSGNQSFFICGF